MRIRPFGRVLRNGDLSLLRRVDRMTFVSYQAFFLAALSSSGLLAAMASGPLPFDSIITTLNCRPDMGEALRSWLELGVTLKLLRRSRRGYDLRRGIARQLAGTRSGAMAASLEYLTQFGGRLVLETPERTTQGRRFSLQEQPGALVAVTSGLIGPFVSGTIDDLVSPTGAVRLLDIGCGTGEYIRYATTLNPDLTAVGIELQPEVARLARENLRTWYLERRARIECGDIRSFEPQANFDVAMLHLALHYCPVESRVALLRHVRAFLRRDGRFLITNPIQRKNVRLQTLNLWATMTEGCGRLPTVDQVTTDLSRAGFGHIARTSLIPGGGLFSFVASNSA